jgi:DNA polymerase-3 subunit delta'
MTEQAQNALLKTLEEPDEKNVIILIVQNPEKILPTIKSRCAVKKFNLVGDAEMAEMIGAEKNKKEIIFWSLGRPGLARVLSDEPEELVFREKTGAEFKKLLRDNVSGRFALAENLSKDVPGLTVKLDLWLVLLRENILAGGAEPGISPEKALRLLEQVGDSLDTIKETNANARLVLENLFLNF